MVDKPTPTPGSGMEIPGQGTPPAGQPPAPQPQAGEGKEFLTREEFEAALQQIDRRWQQSATNLGRKQADFVQKVQGDLGALKQTLDIMKASGVQVTPEQEQAMRNQVIARAYETPQGTPGAPAAQPQPEYVPGEEDFEEPPDPVTVQAWTMMEQMGVYINEDDPEVSLLDQSNEQAFIASVKPAIEAKIKRLAGVAPGLAQTPHAPTNLGGSGAPTNEYYGHVVDPDTIWKNMPK